MFLAGDIGGTKTALGLFDPQGQLLHSAQFENAGIHHPESLLQRFIDEHKQCQPALHARTPLQGMCLGIAGPVSDQVCQMTNLPWRIDARQLSAQFGMPCLLVNDLEAFAWSLPFLPDNDFHRLQGPWPAPRATVAVLSIGTGLGEAALLAGNNGAYAVLPGEGGHKNFAPRCVNDATLLIQELKVDAGTQVSAEHLISGPGLPRLLVHMGGEGSLRALEKHEDFARLGATALIIREGLSQPHGVHADVLRRFVTLIAHEASNLALQYGANGGVVIGGGIPPRIASLFDTATFREQFADKRMHHQWLRERSVRLCMNPRAPLWGAFHCLRLTNAGQRFL